MGIERNGVETVFQRDGNVYFGVIIDLDNSVIEHNVRKTFLQRGLKYFVTFKKNVLRKVLKHFKTSKLGVNIYF